MTRLAIFDLTERLRDIIQQMLQRDLMGRAFGLLEWAYEATSWPTESACSVDAFLAPAWTTGLADGTVTCAWLRSYGMSSAAPICSRNSW